ncbi:MAG: alpha/beta hydrolase [Granulosicoccus sp.]
MTRRHNCRLLDRKKGLNWPLLLVLLVGAFLQSCASPGGKLERLAKDKGLYQKNVRAAGYDLTSFANRPFSVKPVPETESKVLRIYLEGDGSPWKHRTIIMSDPTPRNPLMLRLMALESLPAAYLGRPCYNGTAQDQGCDNSLWTSARYSDTVIESMASGIRALAKRFEATELWLFGHSGGGALALLLAERLPSVSRLITIAGNLDTEAWIRHHGYTPLFSSLNPASQPLLRDSVWQWHLLGAKDAIIPPQLVQPFIVRQPQASAFVLKNFNHGCCWESIWPDVLDALQNDDPARISGTQFKSRAN